MIPAISGSSSNGNSGASSSTSEAAISRREGKPRKIRELIGASLTAFVSLFGALLYLKNLEIPKRKRDVIAAAGAAFGVDAAVFLKCEEIRGKTDRFSPAEVLAVFRDYLKEVNRLCEMIDRMDVQGNRGTKPLFLSRNQ